MFSMRPNISKHSSISLLLAVVCFLNALEAEGSKPNKTGVFVQLFEWRWLDIAQECEQVLGPSGITAVQISPANEHIDHRLLPAPYKDAWWARYQPVSYKLESRSGDRGELAEMIQRCRAASVEVYADVVINHMGNNVGVGIAGTKFDRMAREYQDFKDEDFHTICTIQGIDYARPSPLDATEIDQRAERVKRCQLGELPDLATELPRVQAKLTAYLQDLEDLGITGFRIDASKHMEPSDIGKIIAPLTGHFIFQEVIDTRVGSTSVFEYLENGSATEFLYSLRIGEAFAKGELSKLRELTEAGGLIPPTRALCLSIIMTINGATEWPRKRRTVVVSLTIWRQHLC